MRYYLDEDLSSQVAERLRKKGLDATSSHEEMRNGTSDAEQLRWAASQERCLVSRNRDDFIELTVSFFENLEPHAGVLIVPYSLPNNQFSRLADALADYASRHPDGMQPYTLDFL